MSKKPNKKKKNRKKPETGELPRLPMTEQLWFFGWTSAMTVVFLCAGLGAFGSLWLAGKRAGVPVGDVVGVEVAVCAVIGGLIGGRLSKQIK